ncbi:hepatitis A virus cellular receptor 1 homolog [Pleurodeles waltl]|uniref:hepatitis A virus cellular receptor 1 homolog n=1 Tax=Pleurodeles waltl TaxID=8319 RepID=UPI003709C473
MFEVCVLLCWNFLLTIGSPVTPSAVRGAVGQSITLFCTYPVMRWSDVSSMCWGRGRCRYSGCGTEILRTDGWKVTWSKSTRYHMKGDIQGGEVSLTIEDVSTSDTGTYCCRVEISGWFNDLKHMLNFEVDLDLESVPAPKKQVSEIIPDEVHFGVPSTVLSSQCPSTQTPPESQSYVYTIQIYSCINKFLTPPSHGTNMEKEHWQPRPIFCDSRTVLAP